jgi:hypothetical protein
VRAGCLGTGLPKFAGLAGARIGKGLINRAGFYSHKKVRVNVGLVSG